MYRPIERPSLHRIGPTLARREAAGVRLEVVLTGIGTGPGAAAPTALLKLVQHTAFGPEQASICCTQPPGLRHGSTSLC